MAVGIYMDVHIPSAISVGLLIRGVKVLTAQEDGFQTLPDRDLLTRATSLGMLFCTHDDDLLKEVSRRIVSGETFSGVVFSHQLYSPIGRCVEDLEIIAKTLDPSDLVGRVEFIPL